MNENTFLGIIERSIHRHWDMPAMTDYEGTTFYYKDFAKEIDKLHDYFRAAGIKPGDKISLAGRNSARWAISFFATLSYGAVVVSILHEFDRDSIKYIINHSDSTALFVDESIWENLDQDGMTQLKTVFSLDYFSLLQTSGDEISNLVIHSDTIFAEKYKNGFSANNLSFHAEEPEELAVINYTSGTTSNPKGVMIPYRSLWSNTRFANDNLRFVSSGDGIVCMLPMAHAYGLAFEILNSISMGCHIYFLSKVPSPKILIDMFAKVKPRLVLAVPLIVEKIIVKNVFPKLQKGATGILIKIPILNVIIYNKVRKSLIELFGGEIVELVIGGAALNREVELFLRKINFPYTVGYGMTECGPLISYAWWKDFKQKSVGVVVDRMQVRIDSNDPENKVGEIQVKGTNVMLGYYKNEEATGETITEDGWLKTGDLGVIDRNGSIFIRGRNKNMILGASGQNIYPEEIEDRINNYPYIIESLAIEKEGKIVALIVPDVDVLSQMKIEKEGYPAFFDNWLKDINSKLPVYSRISSYQIRDEEFEKTPKRSIKRFKYRG
jgi:long-chain acyl-CoA synthetase